MKAMRGENGIPPTRDASESGTRPLDSDASSQQRDPRQAGLDGGQSPGALSRRRVVKAGLAGAAMTYAAPKIALASCKSVLSPSRVSLPYVGTMTFNGETADLSNEASSVYAFSGTAEIEIALNGDVTFTAVSVVGTYMSGTNVGTIKIDLAGPGGGFYGSCLLNATVPVTYECGLSGSPWDETLQVTGTLSSGSSSFSATVGDSTAAPDTLMEWPALCC